MGVQYAFPVIFQVKEVSENTKQELALCLRFFLCPNMKGEDAHTGLEAAQRLHRGCPKAAQI